MVNSMQKFTFGCVHSSSSIEKWTTLVMDCIVCCEFFAMFSSFSTTFVVSSNVLACLYINCCHNSNNNPIVKCFSTKCIDFSKYYIDFFMVYALKHAWNLFCNVIIFSYTSCFIFPLTLKPFALVNSIQVLNVNWHYSHKFFHKDL